MSKLPDAIIVDLGRRAVEDVGKLIKDRLQLVPDEGQRALITVAVAATALGIAAAAFQEAERQAGKPFVDFDALCAGLSDQLFKQMGRNDVKAVIMECGR